MGHSPVMAHVMLKLRFTYCIAYVSTKRSKADFTVGNIYFLLPVFQKASLPSSEFKTLKKESSVFKIL